jgi:hypothetical protein
MRQQEEEDSREVNVGEEIKDGGKGRPTVSNPMTVCHGAVIANAWVDGHQRCATAGARMGWSNRDKHFGFVVVVVHTLTVHPNPADSPDWPDELATGGGERETAHAHGHMLGHRGVTSLLKWGQRCVHRAWQMWVRVCDVE